MALIVQLIVTQVYILVVWSACFVQFLTDEVAYLFVFLSVCCEFVGASALFQSLELILQYFCSFAYLSILLVFVGQFSPHFLNITQSFLNCTFLGCNFVLFAYNFSAHRFNIRGELRHFILHHILIDYKLLHFNKVQQFNIIFQFIKFQKLRQKQRITRKQFLSNFRTIHHHLVHTILLWLIRRVIDCFIWIGFVLLLRYLLLLIDNYFVFILSTFIWFHFGNFQSNINRQEIIKIIIYSFISHGLFLILFNCILSSLFIFNFILFTFFSILSFTVYLLGEVEHFY